MKELLFNALIGVTLAAFGAIAGYSYSQMSVLQRFDGSLKTGQIIYDAGDIHYIVVGDSLTTDKY